MSEAHDQAVPRTISEYVEYEAVCSRSSLRGPVRSQSSDQTRSAVESTCSAERRVRR